MSTQAPDDQADVPRHLSGDWIRPLSVVTLATWLLACVTGLWVMIEYPTEFGATAAAAYEDMENLSNDVTWELWVRRIHTWLATCAVLLGLVVSVTAVTSRVANKLTLPFIGFTAACAATWIVGFVIPWDHFSLSSFIEETSLPGLPSPFEESGTFLGDRSRWSSSTVRSMRSLHQWWLPAVAAVFAVATAGAAQTHRSQRRT